MADTEVGGGSRMEQGRVRRPTRLAVAVHEAGHAIINLIDAESPIVAGMSLDPGNGSLGHVDAQPRWAGWLTDRPAPDIETHVQWLRHAADDVIFFLAGPIAEMRWMRHSRMRIQWGAGEMADRCLAVDGPSFGSDLHNVARRLRWSHPGGERDAFIASWLATETIVAARLDVILRLGRLLDRAGELDVEALDAFREEFLVLDDRSRSSEAAIDDRRS